INGFLVLLFKTSLSSISASFSGLIIACFKIKASLSSLVFLNSFITSSLLKSSVKNSLLFAGLKAPYKTSTNFLGFCISKNFVICIVLITSFLKYSVFSSFITSESMSSNSNIIIPLFSNFFVISFLSFGNEFKTTIFSVSISSFISFVYFFIAIIMLLSLNFSLITPSIILFCSLKPVIEQITSTCMIFAKAPLSNFKARIPMSLFPLLRLLTVKYPFLLSQKLTTSFSADITTPLSTRQAALIYKVFDLHKNLYTYIIIKALMKKITPKNLNIYSPKKFPMKFLFEFEDAIVGVICGLLLIGLK